MDLRKDLKEGMFPSRRAVAEFLVPYWGIKLAMAQGWRTGPPANMASGHAGQYDNPMP